MSGSRDVIILTLHEDIICVQRLHVLQICHEAEGRKEGLVKCALWWSLREQCTDAGKGDLF